MWRAARLELKMGKQDAQRHQALFVARRDWFEASGYAYQLLKKGWHGQPAYLRRGSVRILQQAVTDALIIAYMRPWSPVVLKDYSWADAEEQALHQHVRELRNEVVGHSTPAHNSVRPWVSGDFSTHIESFPHPYFSEDNLVRLRAMASRLANEADVERRTILVKYVGEEQARKL
jgi:hypothetical protein